MRGITNEPNARYVLGIGYERSDMGVDNMGSGKGYVMDMEKKIDKLYEAVYEGVDGTPSIKEDIATIKTKIDSPCPVGKSNKTLII